MDGTLQQLLKALAPLGRCKSAGRGQYKYNCPICEADGAPADKFNLEVNYNKRVYNCWACNLGGRNFKMLVDRVGIKQYSHLFEPDKTEVDEDDEPKEIPIELPSMCQNVLRSKKATNYLIKERGLTKKQIRERRIKWCFKGQYENCIIFPSYDKNDQLNYFVAHSLDSFKYYRCRGSSNVCFYESFLDRRMPIIVTEGIYDALSLPNANPWQGVQWNEAILDFLSGCTIFTVFDSQIKKSKLRQIHNALKEVGAQVIDVHIPTQYEDANDMHVKNHDALIELLKPYYNVRTAA